GLIDQMPNPDAILREEGPEIYDRMLADPHIRAVLRQRVTRVLGRPWDLRPFDESAFAKEVADFVRDDLTREVNLDNVLGHLMQALPYGFSVAEVVWHREDTYRLKSIKARRWTRFGFRPDG